MHVAERLDIEPIEQANGRGYSAAVQAYFAHYRLGLAGDGGEAAAETPDQDAAPAAPQA